MKTVVITGANRGIGLGFCQHYLQAGWQVIALTRTPMACHFLSSLLTQQQTNFHNVLVDLSDEQSIFNLKQKIKQHTQKIDLLINNAGIAEHQYFGQLTQQALLNTFNINAVAPTLICQTLVELMVEPSKIVQLSSGLASINSNLAPLENFDAYCMSKVALNMMSKRLAEKLKPKNISIYAISPGWVKTDMGGEQAPLSIEEAVKILSHTIQNLSNASSGLFLDEQGHPINW